MENNQSEKKPLSEMVNQYKQKNQINSGDNLENNMAKTANIPNNNTSYYQEMMQKETDPDLIISYEVVKLPSKGLFYENKLSEVQVEYMTSKDEDLLTTPSLIESGRVLDILLKRKIKTKGVNVNDLLPGDRNAILLFLRTSSYGNQYTVTVPDPRTGVHFEEEIDLTKLKYKEVKETPDEDGYFSVYIPMRKKMVKLKLISSGEDDAILKNAEEIKEAYNNEFTEYNTMKLKASIVSIDGKSDRNYINKFVDAMPARDSLTIRRKLRDISPDIDMEYEFRAKDGYKFKANLQMGVDFFFPSN